MHNLCVPRSFQQKGKIKAATLISGMEQGPHSFPVILEEILIREYITEIDARIKTRTAESKCCLRTREH